MTQFRSEPVFAVSTKLYNAHIDCVMDISFFYDSYRWRNILHNHNHAELFFVMEGSCALLIERETLHFRKNDVFCVPAKLYHKITEQSPDLLLHAFRLNASPIRMEYSGFDAYSLLTGKLLEESSVHALYDFSDGIEQIKIIRSEMRWRDEGFEELFPLYFQLFFIKLLRVLRQTPVHALLPEERFDIDPSGLMPPQRVNVDVSIIEDYFNFHQSTSPHIETLAKMLNLTPNYTHKLIRQLYGVSFVQKLTRTRVVKAQHMLSKGNSSVEQIAEAVGYGSVNGFRAAFRKETGLTPSEYRRRAQAGLISPET